MTEASDLKNRLHKLIDDGGGREQYENDGDATNLKQFDFREQSSENIHFSHIHSKKEKKEILDHNFNPFVFDCKLSLCDKLMTAIFTVFILPCRLFLIAILLFTAWILATIGLWGLSFEDISAKPLCDWRRKLQGYTALLMRGVFYVGSFSVKINGTRTTTKEAPILVVAPHSSVFDPIAIVFMGPPSVVAKAETASTPIIGKLVNFTQPIFVSREDPDSRQKTIKSIIERSSSDKNWQQIIIFPEGTCTNRTCLIKFKPGAFYPTVPVQPVCLRFPDKYDTVTWAWEGPGALQLLWLTLCRPRTHVIIDLLPVYTPNEEEKKNPKLFAANVRKVMAEFLKVPTLDYSYDDCKLLKQASNMNIPHFEDIIELKNSRIVLGLTETNIEKDLCTSHAVNHKNCRVTLSDFATRLNVDAQNPEVKEMFDIFDPDAAGKIDIREYLICAVFLMKNEEPVITIIKILSQIYHDPNTESGILSLNDLNKILHHTMDMEHEDVEEIFEKVDSHGRGVVTIDELTDYLKDNPDFEHLFAIPMTKNIKTVEKKSQ